MARAWNYVRKLFGLPEGWAATAVVIFAAAVGLADGLSDHVKTVLAAIGPFWLLLAFELVLVVAYRRHEQAKKARAQAKDAEGRLAASIDPAVLASYRRAFDEACDAAKKIANQSHAELRTEWRYTKVRERYVVDADGTTTAERVYEIEAGPHGTRFWRVRMSADDTAKQVNLPHEINFTADNIGPDASTAVTWLPYYNRPLEKHFIVFFLPQIEAGESRRLRVSYRWPGFASDLCTGGSTDMNYHFRTCEVSDSADVEIEWRFAKTLGVVTMKPTLLLAASEHFSQLLPEQDHYVFRYACPNLAMHERRLAFEVRRT